MATKKTPAKRTVPQIKAAVSERVDSPIEAGERAAALKTAADVSYDKIVANMSTLSAEVGKTFSSIQQQLTGKVQELEVLDRAITAKGEQLQELLDVEVLVVDLQQAEAQHRKHLEDIEEAYTKKTSEMNAEREAARQRWVREAEEWAYALKQKQQAELDEFERTKRVRSEELFQKDKHMAEQWAAREKKLAEQEAEYAKAIEAATNFPALLQKEVDKAVAIATNSLKKDLTHQFAMEKKDLESALAMEKARLNSADAALLRITEENEALRAATAEAQNRVVEIAKEGFSGFGGQTALQSVMKLKEENGVSSKKS
jgi:hypothetical protein